MRDLLSGAGSKSLSAEDVRRSFRGARRNDVASVLGTLGLLVTFETDDGPRWSAV